MINSPRIKKMTVSEGRTFPGALFFEDHKGSVVIATDAHAACIRVEASEVEASEEEASKPAIAKLIKHDDLPSAKTAKVELREDSPIIHVGKKRTIAEYADPVEYPPVHSVSSMPDRENRTSVTFNASLLLNIANMINSDDGGKITIHVDGENPDKKPIVVTGDSGTGMLMSICPPGGTTKADHKRWDAQYREHCELAKTAILLNNINCEDHQNG